MFVRDVAKTNPNWFRISIRSCYFFRVNVEDARSLSQCDSLLRITRILTWVIELFSPSVNFLYNCLFKCVIDNIIGN